MNNPFFKRSAFLVLALILILGAAPLGARAFTLVQLKGTDVTLDETSFPYTGQEIRPNVTVRVEDALLTLDRDYTLEYRDNIEVGTGKVIVTGIGTASTTVGYTGTVEVEFAITDPAPYTLKGTDVTMDGAEFPYTGSYITPAVTVTVNGKVLTPGIHYALTYHNNIAAGTATATIDGIEDAGYTGQVNLNFTILPDPGTPEETEPEETEPEETKPEETQPEETKPEETQPESVTYKLTKGDKATWYKNSAKTLSFTSNGKYADFLGVQIDGKDLDSKYYTLKEGTTVILKSAYLQTLAAGSCRITLLFEDGQAEGTFQVSAALDTTNPETGDSFRMELWVCLMGMSLAGAMSLVVLRKKIF